MIEFINQLALDAGNKSLEFFGKLKPSDISSKATEKDLVSTADKAVENFIISRISEKFPDHDIFGEETGATSKNSEFCWIIDPIDGTQSFVKSHPYYGISIALYKNGRGYAGAVNAPALNKIFTAQCGKGAFMNGNAIHVSQCRHLKEAACATGFARLRENKVGPILEKFSRIVPELRSIHRCGSAAIDLAFTAAGIYDGFWEEGLQLYDVAAGVIIVQEAGGIVTDFNGGESFSANGIIAGNQMITAGLKKLLTEK